MKILAELEFYAMATLKQKDTGFVVMWMRPNLEGTAEQNKEPRIKIRTDNRDTGTGIISHSVSMTISDNPVLIEPKDKSGNSLDKKVEKKAIEFIKFNKVALLQFWNDEIDDDELKTKIKLG